MNPSVKPPSIAATLIAALILIASIIGLAVINQNEETAPEPQASETTIEVDNAEIPEVILKTEVVVDGLTKPWEVGFLPTGEMLYTERGGDLTVFREGQKTEVRGLPEIQAVGEGGLLGLAVDPEYETNQFIYICYNTAQDVRVSRFRFTFDTITRQTDIVTGMPVNNTTFPGRHSGCRIVFGEDRNLWIGTGDVADSSHPQDPQSLGGKILRVDRDGNPVEGNLPEPFDPRIHSYGHRNVQGIAMARDGESFIGFSVQHGPDTDDEVNLLVSGNFGWDPKPQYDEQVPMTDTEKFPDAIEAVWSSGKPTLAPSGATIIYGDQWGDLSGNLFVGMQKTKHIRMFTVSETGDLGQETELLKDEFGRIRTVVQAPDGEVYFLTDNGEGRDKIVRIVPSL